MWKIFQILPPPVEQLKNRISKSAVFFFNFILYFLIISDNSKTWWRLQLRVQPEQHPWQCHLQEVAGLRQSQHRLREDSDPQGLLSLRLQIHPGRSHLECGAERGWQGDLHQQGSVLRSDSRVQPRPWSWSQVIHSQVCHHARLQVAEESSEMVKKLFYFQGWKVNWRRDQSLAVLASETTFGELIGNNF